MTIKMKNTKKIILKELLIIFRNYCKNGLSLGYEVSIDTIRDFIIYISDIADTDMTRFIINDYDKFLKVVYEFAPYNKYIGGEK